MIKLLHTGDIHLGKQFPWLQTKADEYRNQLIKTFEKIIDLARTEGVSLLLIAGDLFDTNRVHGLTVSKVLAAFKKLETSNIRVCIIPGCRDNYGDDSLYRSLPLPSNVTVFTPENSRQTYKDLNLTVYGMVPETESWERNPLQGLSLVRESRFHVGMAHCLFNLAEPAPDDQAVLGKEEISGSGLDYLALGHRHFFQDCSQGHTAASYCGSPEPLDMDCDGAGNAVMITLTEDNKAEFLPIPVGMKKCNSIMIDMSSSESIDTVIRMLESRSDPGLILEVILTGTTQIDHFPNVQEIENKLNERFFNLRVIDKTRPELGTENLQHYTEKTLIGRYLRIIEGKIAAATTEEDKSLYEEALKLGFTLLQGNLKAIE